MSIENIAREEYLLHRQAEEKEKVIEELRICRGLYYVLAVSSATTAAKMGTALYQRYQQLDPGSAKLGEIILTGLVIACCFSGAQIPYIHKKMRKAEGELEKIKQKPEYKQSDVPPLFVIPSDL